MKKIAAIAVAAAGFLWAAGRRKVAGQGSSWAEGTDAV